MTITAAADGSALGNPGPAGWAWYVDENTWAAGGWKHATNNIGELTAVLELFRSTAHLDDDLLILCDSQYVINSVTKWMPGWKRKGWRKGDGKPVMNLELIQELDAAIAGPPLPLRVGEGPRRPPAQRGRRRARPGRRRGLPARSPGSERARLPRCRHVGDGCRRSGGADIGPSPLRLRHPLPRRRSSHSSTTSPRRAAAPGDGAADRRRARAPHPGGARSGHHARRGTAPPDLTDRQARRGGPATSDVERATFTPMGEPRR